MARLDLVGEHRDYCPWIDAVSQNGPAVASSSRLSDAADTAQMMSVPDQEKEKAGWEVLAKVLLNAVRTKRQERADENPTRGVRPFRRRRADGVSVNGTFATGTQRESVRGT